VGNSEILSLLNSDREDLIIQGIEMLREKGNCKLIPNIVELLRENESNIIGRELKGLLFDIKDIKSIPYFIKEIKNKENKKILSILVSSCWQSGLDYSDHIDVFLQSFINENYAVSIEAFTLIETLHLEQKLNTEKLDSVIKELRLRISKMSNEKQALAEELLKTLNPQPATRNS